MRKAIINPDVAGEFPAKLKELRLWRKLTQVELACAAGMAQGRLCHLEKKNRRPSYQEILNLAAALGVNPTEFAKPLKKNAESA